MSSREQRLTLGGLVTQPSKYLTTPGTLKQAVNVMCRQPGYVEPRHGYRQYADPGSAAGRLPRVISTIGDEQSLVFSDAAANDTWATGLRDKYWIGAATTQINVTGSDPTWATHGMSSRARGRFFVDSMGSASAPDCVRVLDSEGDATARLGGLIPPSIVEVVAGAAGDAVGGNKFVGYRAHFVRKFSDGYIQTGPVSPQTRFENSSAAGVLGTVTVRWAKALAYSSWVQAGDFVQVYRTDGVASADLIGDVHHLTAEIKLTATDITNGYATITDVTADDGLGEFLYTNSGQGTSETTRGIDGSKWYPPSAVDMCPFRGCMWYATPYVPLTYSLRVPGVYGGHASGVAEGRSTGLGTFQVLGDTTTGLSTLTNVSAIDMTGLAVGQRMISATSGYTPGAATITIIGLAGTTITLSGAVSSTTSPGETFGFVDRIEIEGVVYDNPNPGWLTHGMAAGTATDSQQVWLFFDRAISYEPASMTASGSAETGVTITMIAPSRAGTRLISLRGTNGANYSPAIPVFTASATDFGSDDPRLNRAHFSDIEEPESVPLLNYRFAGAGRLLRMIATEDVMLWFCTDGTYAVIGDGKDWDVRPFDLALKLLHRNAVGIMNGAIWALTNRGLVVIEGASPAQDVSTPFIGNTISELNQDFLVLMDPYVFTHSVPAYSVMLACDPGNKEVWIRYRADGTFVLDGGGTLVFNLETKTWSTIAEEAISNYTAVAYIDRALTKTILVGIDPVASLAGSSVLDQYPSTDVTPAHRMIGGVVELNPFTAGDVNSKKQFFEVIWDFEFIAPPELAQDLEILPFFGDVEYAQEYELPFPQGEIEHKISVPRAAANSNKLEPGLQFTGDAERANIGLWRITGLTVKFRPASGDTRRT